MLASRSSLPALVPEIGGDNGFVRLAVQHQPDTRIHCVRADGTVAILVSDPLEEVLCWIEFETDGTVEDVCVLPSGEEDAVYYTVRRPVNGVFRRFTEKWSLERECRGGTLSKCMDSHVTQVATSATRTMTGLSHLEGKTVAVWADGLARDDEVVSGGQITISGASAKQIVAGLKYEARYKSVKLAFGAQKGTALTMPKHVDRIGFVLADTHALGLKFGRDFDNLDPLPLRPDYGPATDPDTVFSEYDFDGIAFDGEWSSDARVCLFGQSPYPCTVMAGVLGMDTVDR